jgi:hypothetical protein
MGVVFVHGVGVRNSTEPAWIRDQLLIRSLAEANLARVDSTVQFAFWGDHGVHWRLGGRSLNIGTALESLGASSDPVFDIVSGLKAGKVGFSQDTEEPWSDSEQVADALIAVLALSPDSQGLPVIELISVRDQLVNALNREAVEDFFDNDGSRLINELSYQNSRAGGLEYLGQDTGRLRSSLVWARQKMVNAWAQLRSVPADSAGDTAGLLARHVTQRLTTGSTGLLAGDVALYLAKRGDARDPGPIQQVILQKIEASAAAGGPMVLVGHSLGATLLVDALTRFAPGRWAVQLLLTVGAQVAVFADAGLIMEAQELRADGRLSCPTGVIRWINIVDTADPLSFVASTSFDRVEDYKFDTRALRAHSAYLTAPGFYQRLTRRLQQKPQPNKKH